VTINLFAAAVTAVATFAATNVDDIVLLMLWFSQRGPDLRGEQIVAGQYLGFVALVALSLLGFLGALVVPPAWVGLLGLVPLSLGLRRLWQRRWPTTTPSPQCCAGSSTASLSSTVVACAPPRSTPAPTACSPRPGARAPTTPGSA
jgi:cadmium resistance protein CadD (predicted permease)